MSALIVLGGAGTEQGAAPACTAVPVREQAQRLSREFGDRFGRFLVRTRDGDAASLAADLMAKGAAAAEPIGGQPLLVVEIHASTLPELAADPRVLCIEADRPEPPTP